MPRGGLSSARRKAAHRPTGAVGITSNDKQLRLQFLQEALAHVELMIEALDKGTDPSEVVQPHYEEAIAFPNPDFPGLKDTLSSFHRQRTPKVPVIPAVRRTSTIKNSPIAPHQMTFITRLLNQFMRKSPAIDPFLQPVDTVKYGCPTYYDVIEHPCDFSTVKGRLENGEYQTAQDFAKDVELIFTNAMKFNPKTHQIHVTAKELLEQFRQRWNDLPPDEGRSTKIRPPKTPAPSQRAPPTNHERDSLKQLFSQLREARNLQSEDIFRFFDAHQREPGMTLGNGFVDVDFEIISPVLFWKLYDLIQREYRSYRTIDENPPPVTIKSPRLADLDDDQIFAEEEEEEPEALEVGGSQEEYIAYETEEQPAKEEHDEVETLSEDDLGGGEILANEMADTPVEGNVTEASAKEESDNGDGEYLEEEMDPSERELFKDDGDGPTNGPAPIQT